MQFLKEPLPPHHQGKKSVHSFIIVNDICFFFRLRHFKTWEKEISMKGRTKEEIVRNLRKRMDLPVTPQKRFQEVGVGVEDANLNILMIPMNHSLDPETGLEYYLYDRISKEKLFPNDCVVYMESKHEGRIIHDPPFDMMKGKDYVYEEEINREYRAVTYVMIFLSMLSGYKLAHSSTVRNNTIKHQLYWLSANISTMHGEEFIEKQKRDIEALERGRPPNLLLWREWVVRRAIALEASWVLLSILYYNKLDETGNKRAYSNRSTIIQDIQDLIERKNEAIDTGNETIEDVKQIQAKMAEEALLVAEFADQLRSTMTEESEHALIFTDYLKRMALKHDEFPRIETKAGEILGMLEDLVEILRNPGDHTMESKVSLQYMFQMGTGSKKRKGRRKVRRGSIKAGTVEGSIATIPHRIQELMNKEWKLDEETQSVLRPYVKEMDSRLSEFLFVGKRMQYEARRIEELDQNALDVNVRLSQLKNQIAVVKKAQIETRLIASRATNALSFLQNLGKDRKKLPEGKLSTGQKAFWDIIEQAEQLVDLSSIPLDTDRKVWKSHTELIKTIEDLSRTYLHILQENDFTSEFLDLKKTERDLWRLERLNVNRPYDVLMRDFVDLWNGIIDTTIRDAYNLQAVLTLAQRKGVKNVIMLVGTAHVETTRKLIRENHGMLWTVKALSFKILQRTREGYYMAIKRGLKEFTKSKKYKGPLTPTRNPGTPFKTPKRRGVGKQIFDDTAPEDMYWNGSEKEENELYF